MSRMAFKSITMSLHSSRWSSALNVESRGDFRSADLFFSSDARGDVSWSTAVCPGWSAGMGWWVQHDVNVWLMYRFVAQRLRYSSRLCASTRLVSLSVTLLDDSVGHRTVSVLDGHSPPLSRLRVLKGVKFVTFGHFGLLRDETFAGWDVAVMLCLRIFPSLAVACRLLPLYRQGCCISLHGRLPSMFHGRLPSAWAVSHGDLSSIYVGWSGCPTAVGLSAAGVGTLPVLLLLWNETWDIF